MKSPRSCSVILRAISVKTRLHKETSPQGFGTRFVELERARCCAGINPAGYGLGLGLVEPVSWFRIPTRLKPVSAGASRVFLAMHFL
jgi:hypothetical protein